MVGALVLASLLAAQAVRSTPALSPDQLPVSVARIQRVLEHEPALKVTQDGTRFHVEVLGRFPTIEEILGPDFLKGPTPATASGMTHQEFLNMVTPQLAQPYAAFTGFDLLQVAATSFLERWALSKAIDKYKSARSEREQAQARKEVEDALAALRKARAAVGLPDK